MTTEIAFTTDELVEFDLATMQNASRDQVTRIKGRLAVRRLMDLHGKEKCDAMWAEIQRREKERKKSRARR